MMQATTPAAATASKSGKPCQCDMSMQAGWSLMMSSMQCPYHDDDHERDQRHDATAGTGGPPVTNIRNTSLNEDRPLFALDDLQRRPGHYVSASRSQGRIKSTAF
jgi:hypothetical protein